MIPDIRLVSGVEFVCVVGRFHGLGIISYLKYLSCRLRFIECFNVFNR